MKVLISIAVIVISTLSIRAQEDWSALFPEIQGCTRTIQAPVRLGKATEQKAEYKTGNYPCGLIVLRREPGLLAAKRKLYMPLYEFFPSTWTKIRGYDTFQGSPLCGNDEWTGSLEIFFEKDKTLTVSAYKWSPLILEFARKIDYSKLSLIMKKH